MGTAERPHPDRQQLEGFMSGRLDRCAARTVVRHLLEGCPQCVEVTRLLWLLGDRAPRDSRTAPKPPARRPPLRLMAWKG